MTCPHCGAEVAEGNRFCPQCRKRVVAPTPGFGTPGGPATPRGPAPPTTLPASAPRPRALSGIAEQSAIAAFSDDGDSFEIRRPPLITAIAVLDFVVAAFALLFVIAGIVSIALARNTDAAAGAVSVIGFYGVMGTAYLAAGMGLLQLREWGRITQIVVACVGLCGFPCGTLIGVLLLVYLMGTGIRVIFSGRPGTELTPYEVAEARKAMGMSGSAVALVVGAVILAGILFIGIIAAIAIPSLLRARVAANEAAAIGHVRSVVTARINGQPLDPSIVLDTPRQGYVLTIKAPSGDATMDAFTVVAVPVVAGRTGVRQFCGDATGLVCALPAGATMDVSSGTCGPSCVPLP